MTDVCKTVNCRLTLELIIDAFCIVISFRSLLKKEMAWKLSGDVTGY